MNSNHCVPIRSCVPFCGVEGLPQKHAIQPDSVVRCGGDGERGVCDDLVIGDIHQKRLAVQMTNCGNVGVVAIASCAESSRVQMPPRIIIGRRKPVCGS